MKTLKSLAKLALAVVVLLSTSACYTTKLGEVHDFQGIVWRGDIVRQFHTNPDSLAPDAQNIELTHFDLATQKFPRATMVRLQDGAFFKALRVGTFLVPDSVEYSDLAKGAIVDMIFQRGDDVDFRVSKFDRVVRLVCSGSDKACIRREWKAGRVNTVIDPHPAADFSNGNTYKRQVSAEERAKYE